MAVGDIVAQLHDVMAPPTTVARADPGIRGVINMRVLRYAAAESYDFLVGFENYNGTSDVAMRFVWTPTATPDGSVTWEFDWLRMEDGHNIDAAWTPTFPVNVVSTQPAALGNLKYESVTFTNAQMDAVQNEEMAALRIRRAAGGQTGDAELVYPRLIFAEA